jgi:hypothetical protein
MAIFFTIRIKETRKKRKDFNVSRSQTQLLNRKIQLKIIEDIVLIHKYAKPMISDQAYVGNVG